MGKRRSGCIPFWRAMPTLHPKVQEVAGFRTRANDRQGGLRRKAHRSHYLPSPTERPPGLSTKTPLEGRASLSTIDAAITPWRDAFAEQTIPAPSIHAFRWAMPTLHPNRGWPVPAGPPVSAYSRTDRTCEEKAHVPFPFSPRWVIMIDATAVHGSPAPPPARVRERVPWIISSCSATSAS